jgi:ubiquinone/menaquinone biosynthesis C-methylase UbiE
VETADRSLDGSEGTTPDNIVNIDFRRHFLIQPGERVLDLGCGSGRHTVEACRWPCRVVGVDLSRQDLRVARYMLADLQRRKIAPGHADFVIADAEHLPFREGAFEKVICTEVLEHIGDDRAGVRELVRVLRPGGDIAVSVPSYWPEVLFWTISWEYWHTPGGHIRMYEPGEMWHTLEEHGLRLRLQRRRHSFQTLYWFVRCVFGKDNDYFPLTRFLTRFINWYHNRRRLRPLEYFEAVLDLVMGKDTILYGTKPPSNDGHRRVRPAEGPATRRRSREAT